MSTTSDVSPIEASGERRELVRLVARIQALTLELRALQRKGATPELRATERTLEQLRWRLAVVARRAATGDLNAAA